MQKCVNMFPKPEIQGMTIIILNVVCNDTIPIYSIFGLNYLQSSDILPIFAARNMNVMNWYEQLPTLCPPLDVLYDVSQAKMLNL